MSKEDERFGPLRRRFTPPAADSERIVVEDSRRPAINPFKEARRSKLAAMIGGEVDRLVGKNKLGLG